MKALVVYANPNPESLSGRVCQTIVETLNAKGDTVEVRDLYKLGFNPVLTAEEQAGNAQGKLMADVLEEQKHLSQADVVFFVYPIWWAGLPAIMKGWFDRVLTYGYAYRYGAKGLEKMLKGKKAVILNNHGNPLSAYEGAMYNALRMGSDTGIIDFCGFELVEHKFFPSASSAPEEAKLAYLQDVRRLCEKIA